MQWEISLLDRIKNIQSHSFLHDFGGGGPLSQCYIMAYLVSFFKLENYVEIGVYKGRSLFSVSQAFKDNKGKAYGIDPYLLVEAKEYDLEETFRKKVNGFLEGIDFENMYQQVLMNTELFELSKVVEVIRKTSTEAIEYFKDIGIYMLYIDGNHDRKNVRDDINNYAPLIRDGGIIVFDCINWDSVKDCYDQYKNDYIILFETNDFGILMNKVKNQKNLDSAALVSKKLKSLYSTVLEIENEIQEKKYKGRYLENYDLVIIDDVFPHPVSGFRYQEFLSYFKHFNSIKVLTTGSSVHVLGNKTVHELVIDFKRNFPQIGGNLEVFSSFDNINCKLFYFVFLQNADSVVELAERRRIPFVFTLYPGGSFGLDNASSDQLLKRVIDSPCFRKVIVTQQVTYNYLIDKDFCKPEQIEYIFGVVTPLDKVEREFVGKKHYKIDKDNLDICFVAHKYTDYGQDKGYDLFIDVAKQLVRMHSNIHFHVVGNFDEKVIDISEIKDNITFYGIQLPNWFDGFYNDKDIILSPNIPYRIYAGSFDGFPTASCTDAGLCKTAIFCTDPLDLNNSHFKDNEQIVIIKGIKLNIIDKIEYYYNNPLDLKDICENGYKAMKDLYSFDNQIAPRIRLLKANIK